MLNGLLTKCFRTFDSTKCLLKEPYEKSTIQTHQTQKLACLLQGGEHQQDTFSLQVISRKRTLELVAFSRKMTYNLKTTWMPRHPMGLCRLFATLYSLLTSNWQKEKRRGEKPDV